MNNDLSYKNILKSYNDVILQDQDGAAPESIPVEPKKQSSSFDSITKTILPILLGLGSTSMLFGQGLFGIGRNNKYFGGWLGQSLGGIGALTLLPSLWSDKDLGSRLKGAFEKLKQGDLLEALKIFFGISSEADKALNDGKKQATSVEAQKKSIEQRRKKYIQNGKSVEKIREWMKNNHYQIDNNSIQLTEDITCFGFIPQYENETNALGKDKVICIITKSNKGFQATLNKVSDLVSLIDSGYANSIKIALTAGKQDPTDVTKNKYRSVTDENNINNLAIIQNGSSPVKNWLEAISQLSNKLKQATKNNITICNNLFGALSQAQGFVLDIPSNLEDVVTQQTEGSVQDVVSDLSKDESLKDLKDDPILNKFDKGIEASENKIENIYVQTLLNALNTANEKDPTAFIITVISGNKTMYYARKPENNYLTDNLKDTIYFTKQQVQKLEGSGDLVKKLETTLQKIHLPQIMKMKNPGIKVVIKQFNVQFTNKFAEFLNKYKIQLN